MSAPAREVWESGSFQLQFSVLGPVRAWRDGEDLNLGPPQQQAVLAMLLLRRGRQVTVDEIVDGVWGERAPRSSVGVVRTYIARLRRLLEPRCTLRPTRSI
jgi:DNA-binding SARP family transcriptional activator